MNTEEENRMKNLIKQPFRRNFEIALDMFIEQPNKYEGEQRDDIDLAEYFLKSLKITQKQGELYKSQGYRSRISDIDCQIQYSFLQNGSVV
jgi:hypothetical protein